MKKTSKQIQKEIVLLLIDQFEAGKISTNRLKEISQQILAIIPDKNSDQDELPTSVTIRLKQIPEIKTIFK